MHVDGGQANQTGVALITAAVQHANHSPHGMKVYKVLNFEDLVGEKKKYLINIFDIGYMLQ